MTAGSGASARATRVSPPLKLSGIQQQWKFWKRMKYGSIATFENYPMFMAGIRRNGALVMLICIREAA